MITFTTDRLTVSPWVERDLNRLLDMYSRADVVRYLTSVPRPLVDIESVRNLLEQWRGKSTDPRFGFWAGRRSDGVIVGTVLLAPMTPSFGEHTDGEVEVGWHLHPDSWRRGSATEIAQGALKKGFAEGLTQIYATVKPGNIKSIAVCHRLGMESLGLSSKWDDTEYELFRISNARHSRRRLPVRFRQKHPR